MSERSLIERLVARSVEDPETACRTWTGSLDRWGYGKFSLNGRTEQVHRAAYRELAGIDDESLTLDHLCRNRACWNPEHLELVPLRTNLLRGNGVSGVNARKTHCPAGHEYTEANTYRRPRGDRECRTCRHRSRRSPKKVPATP
jgi:hypothetical protein